MIFEVSGCGSVWQMGWPFFKKSIKMPKWKKLKILNGLSTLAHHINAPRKYDKTLRHVILKAILQSVKLMMVDNFYKTCQSSNASISITKSERIECFKFKKRSKEGRVLTSKQLNLLDRNEMLIKILGTHKKLQNSSFWRKIWSKYGWLTEMQ